VTPSFEFQEAVGLWRRRAWAWPAALVLSAVLLAPSGRDTLLNGVS
jgi:uncharacterized membrane protein (DUF2068 family)